MISINHSLTCYPRCEETYVCEFRVSKPKTEAGIRTIPIIKQLYQILLQGCERQKEEVFCSNEVDGITNFIFTNRFGNPHNPAAVNRAIVKCKFPKGHQNRTRTSI